jgi:hypothetical protein
MCSDGLYDFDAGDTTDSVENYILSVNAMG